MATIALSDTSELRLVNPKHAQVRSYRAGEAIVAGDCVVFDLGEATQKIYQSDLSDADRREVIGIALESCVAGQVCKVAIADALITGWDFDPTSTANHRAGKPVYNGTDGILTDTHATNSMEVGRLYAIADDSDDAIAVMFRPNYTKGA